jgi:hypothetical protein
MCESLGLSEIEMFGKLIAFEIQMWPFNGSTSLVFSKSEEEEG